jgi:predicted phosphodiesterase
MKSYLRSRPHPIELRIAIISDIHGNLVALQTVLSDLQKKRIERIVCLGDVAATGPQPREVTELLRTMKCPCIMGNTDELLAKDLPEDLKDEQISEGERWRLEELDAWTRRQVTGSQRRYLLTFKQVVKLTLGRGLTLLCYHGSPRSNEEEILAITPDEELSKCLEGHTADMFAGGHTHAQMLRRFRNSIIFNPGSVGLAIVKDPSGGARNPARAEYAIVNSDGKTFSVELLSVPYPLANLRRAVQESSMPDPDGWLSGWY